MIRQFGCARAGTDRRYRLASCHIPLNVHPPKILYPPNNNNPTAQLSVMERSSIPNASLVAILLVTQSSSGTNFVFHYPPNPNIDTPASTQTWGGDATDDGRSTTSSSTNSSEDELIDDNAASDAETGIRKSHLDNLDFEGANSESDRRSRSYAGERGGRQSSRRMRDDHEDDDEEDDDGAKTQPAGPPWENVFGLKTTFLASLLAPKASMCRTKFELSIDDLVFLGYPVQIRPDGTWKKQRRRRNKVLKSNASELTASIHGTFTGGNGHDGDEKNNQGYNDEVLNEEETAAGNDADDEHEPGDDQKSDGTEEDKEDGGRMSMFHVVFVLNPPQLEYHTRVQEMYQCVVKKFARALKLEQARTDYVGNEAELVLRMKEKAIQDGRYLRINELGLHY